MVTSALSAYEKDGTGSHGVDELDVLHVRSGVSWALLQSSLQIVKCPRIVRGMRTLELVPRHLLRPDVLPPAARFEGEVQHLARHALVAAAADVARIQEAHVRCLRDDQAGEDGEADEVACQAVAVEWRLGGFVQLRADDLSSASGPDQRLLGADCSAAQAVGVAPTASSRNKHLTRRDLRFQQ